MACQAEHRAYIYNKAAISPAAYIFRRPYASLYICYPSPSSSHTNDRARAQGGGLTKRGARCIALSFAVQAEHKPMAECVCLHGENCVVQDRVYYCKLNFA